MRKKNPVPQQLVAAHIPQELLKRVDELIRRGLFSSRSEAIRYALYILTHNNNPCVINMRCGDGIGVDLTHVKDGVITLKFSNSEGNNEVQRVLSMNAELLINMDSRDNVTSIDIAVYGTMLPAWGKVVRAIAKLADKNITGGYGVRDSGE